jgi:hypothetical protein
MSDPVEAIRATLAKFPRMHGYYLLKVVDIEWADDEEASLDVIMQQLDDHPWPPREQRPTFPCWTEYVITEEDAREMVITGLVGGANVGHTRDTISRPTATAVWDQFRSLFSERVRFFRNDGFGDRRYVFSTGVVAVDVTRAGILVVVESD